MATLVVFALYAVMIWVVYLVISFVLGAPRCVACGRRVARTGRAVDVDGRRAHRGCVVLSERELRLLQLDRPPGGYR